MNLSEKYEKRKEFITMMCSVVAIALLEYMFFKKVLFNDRLIGDINDARLNNLLVEHWFRAFQGKESFSMVNIFYPMEGTLAFTDMLMGFAIPYSILRAFGVNMFLANKIVLIGFHIYGSYTLYYLLKKKFKINSLWSLVGVVIFAYSSAYYIRIAHTQLICISLIPTLIIFIYSFFQNFQNGKKRVIYGFLSITTYVLIMYTSWYTAFFTALFFLTLIFTYLVVSYANKNHVLKDVVWLYIKQKYKEVIAYVVYLIAIIIPFFKLYIPVSRMFGKRTYGEIVSQLPELIDFFNVSTGNRMLGWVIEKMKLNDRYETDGLFVWELHVGFSIVVMGLLVFAFFYTRRKYLKEKYKALETDKCYSNHKMMRDVSLIYAVFISFILLVQSNGASLWLFVYKLVPGASAIRAVVRYNFFLTLPIAIIIAYLGNRICAKVGFKKPVVNGICAIVIPVALACIIWYSNSNIVGIQSDWTSTEENRQLDAVAAPPEDCKVMYIVDTKPEANKYQDDEYSWVSYQHLAWEICYKYDLMNLNGYSGQFPIGWRLGEVTSSDIHKYATDWVEGTCGSEGVYYYDLGTNTWNKYKAVK
ncbi:MAG: hypothetical protein ACI4D4_04200 [Lachnospira sp.]